MSSNVRAGCHRSTKAGRRQWTEARLPSPEPCPSCRRYAAKSPAPQREPRSGARWGEGAEETMMIGDIWESAEMRDWGGYEHSQNSNRNNMRSVDACHLKNILSYEINCLLTNGESGSSVLLISICAEPGGCFWISQFIYLCLLLKKKNTYPLV